MRSADTGIFEGARRGLLQGLLLSLLTAVPAAAAEHQAHPEAAPGTPVFVSLQPIVLPVIEGNTVTRQVGVVLTLELFEGQTALAIEERRRQLTDAFITELHRIYAWRSSADHVVNEVQIKERLLRVANGVMGAGVVRAVLIRQLLEQER